MKLTIPIFPETTTVVTDEVTEHIINHIHQYVVESPKLNPRQSNTSRRSSSKKKDVKLIPRKKSVQKSDK